MAKCRACESEIVWAIWKATGAHVAIDAEPSEMGNLVVVGGRRTPVVEHAGQLSFFASLIAPKRYRAHWSTCTHAAAWRDPIRHP